MTKKPTGQEISPDDAEVRQRILGAAFVSFIKNGYAETSTLEIATRARVSKATLYALVGNKRQMLAACIGERARRFAAPAPPPVVDREGLARTLVAFGSHLLQEMTAPTVIAVFRLAICEAVRAPEVAETLDKVGGETSRTALRAIMSQARSAGLVSGQPDTLAEQFSAMLWGTLMVGLLLGVVERPTPHELARRARDATAAFLAQNGRPT